jgi:Flp pilus assembly protein TadD
MVRLTSFVLFVFILLSSPRSLAQKSATIGGNVYYSDGMHTAGGVSVELTTSEHDLLATEVTNENGEFRFYGLKRAIYTIKINLNDYEPVSVDVDVSMTSDRGVTIYLKSQTKQKDGASSSSSSKTVSVHELSMPVRARELMDSGMNKLYKQKDAESAVPDFQRALSLSPKYYEAETQLAMAQMTLGNRAEAEASFRKALELSDDKYPEAWVGLGAVLLDRGILPEGEKSIRQGLQLNPNLWLGHYELGRALMLEKHLPDALTSAEQARLLAPSVPIIYRLLSKIHLEQKDYPALLADLETYITLDPDSAAGLRAKQLHDQLQQQAQMNRTPASANP